MTESRSVWVNTDPNHLDGFVLTSSAETNFAKRMSLPSDTRDCLIFAMPCCKLGDLAGMPYTIVPSVVQLGLTLAWKACSVSFIFPASISELSRFVYGH